MLDELKILRRHVGEAHENRQPQLLTVYSRFSTHQAPKAHPYVGEIRDSQEIQNFIEDLGFTLKTYGVQSLAAPQVNAPIQVVSVMADGKPLTLVNPTLLAANAVSKEEKFETSVSYPGVRIKVGRPSVIKVSYVDRLGNLKEQDFTGEVAGALAQGIETLNGGSILDHLPAVLRAAAVRKGQLALRKYQNALKAARASKKTPPRKKK